MKIYKNTYFRIETPIYYNSKHGVGFENDQDRVNFHNEALNIFLNDGWELKKERYNGSCSRVIKDEQELYLHPQNFSGVVIEENIPYIEQLINNSNMFQLRWTDTYEEVFDITNEEYMNILKAKRTEIETDIIEAYKTKRSNLYITSSSPISNVLNKYKIKRLINFSGDASSGNLDYKFIADIFEGLVCENKIVTAKTKSGTGYRTDKKFLQKVTA